MVIKVFVSKTSGNMEIKKNQENVISILSGKKYEFEEIDITDPSREEEKKWMWENGAVKEGQRRPLPPQIFNGESYCGDYEAFYEAVENEALDAFLKCDSSQKRFAEKKDEYDINENKELPEVNKTMLNIEHANTVQLFISFERKQVESDLLVK